MAANTIERVRRALAEAFESEKAKVEVWIEKSDYRDFIRMYVVSDYFRGISEKERLGEIYSMLEAKGIGDSIKKISLCIAMTKEEYDEEFGAGTWIGKVGEVWRETKPRPRLRRLAKTQPRG